MLISQWCPFKIQKQYLGNTTYHYLALCTIPLKVLSTKIQQGSKPGSNDLYGGTILLPSFLFEFWRNTITRGAQNLFQHLNNNWIKLAGWVHKILQKTASVQWSKKYSFCWLMILQCNTCTVQSSASTDQLEQLNSIKVGYDFAPYNHTTVQVLYHTVIRQRK